MSDDVTMKRKSYDHLIRTRDRAINEAKWAREMAESAERWGREQCEEQRRLDRRLTRVCFAAAALGVPIDAINRALEAADGAA